MKRVVLVALGMSLACGSDRNAAPVSRLSISVSGNGGDSSQIDLTAGQSSTLELVALGPGASSATFSIAPAISFISIQGSTLTLSPTEADVGSYTLQITAEAAGQTTTLAISVNVASACGVCGAGETCGGGGIAGVCGSAKWSRWVDVISSAGDDVTNSVATDANGNVYAAGASGQSLFLREYDPSGAILLEKTWPSTGSLFVSGLAVAPAGGVVISFVMTCQECVGPDLGGGAAQGIVLASLDGSGTPLWQLDSGPLTAGVGANPAYQYPVTTPSGDIATDGTDSTGNFLALLDPSGRELWRQAKGNISGRPDIAVDDAGHIISASANFSATGQVPPPSLTEYDSQGSIVWQIEDYVNYFGFAVAVAGDGSIALAWSNVGPGYQLGFFSNSDGSLLRVASVNLVNASIAASGSTVVLLGQVPGSINCPYQLEWSDLQGNSLASVPLSNQCPPILSAVAVTLVPSGDAVVGGEFDYPFDFGSGNVYTPRGWDAFVVDVPQ